ncbi:MAG: M20/M25/M40 family metallo-hydrolase, partial [Bacilli bacterium]
KCSATVEQTQIPKSAGPLNGIEVNHNEGCTIVTVYGKQAHGSTPEQGVNAIGNMIQFLTEQGISNTLTSWYNDFIGTQFDGEMLGISYKDAVYGALSVNVGTIKTDEESWEIGLNIRYPYGTTKESIESQIMKTLPSGASMRVGEHLIPHRVDPNHPSLQLLQDVYRAQTGDNTPMMVLGGATYARTMPNGVAFGALFPGREDVAHRADEYMYIEDLHKATSIYMEALYRLVSN